MDSDANDQPLHAGAGADVALGCSCSYSSFPCSYCRSHGVHVHDHHVHVHACDRVVDVHENVAVHVHVHVRADETFHRVRGDGEEEGDDSPPRIDPVRRQIRTRGVFPILVEVLVETN